jgi:hypothetical protein
VQDNKDVVGHVGESHYALLTANRISLAREVMRLRSMVCYARGERDFWIKMFDGQIFGMSMVRVAAKLERFSDALRAISLGEINDPSQFAADLIQNEKHSDWKE